MERQSLRKSPGWTSTGAIIRAFRHGLPCVGLIVFMGSVSFLIAPEEMTPSGSREDVRPQQQAPLVIIDPGHGGIDEGTKYFGLAEKDLTLDVAQRLERRLRQAHVETLMTRQDDVYVPLPARSETANRASENRPGSIFVSIHFNQSGAESVDGVETYYADQKLPPPDDWTWLGFFSHPENEQLDRGENLAASVQSALASRLLLPNRGIKSRSLYVVRHTRVPAILVEAGFLSNKIDNQMLRNDGYRDRIADGIAAGLLGYLQSTRIAPSAPHLALAGNLH